MSNFLHKAHDALLRAVAGDGIEREEGQGMVEYVLIIGVISLVIVLAFVTTGIEGAIKGLASTIASKISGT